MQDIQKTKQKTQKINKHKAAKKPIIMTKNHAPSLQLKADLKTQKIPTIEIAEKIDNQIIETKSELYQILRKLDKTRYSSKKVKKLPNLNKLADNASTHEFSMIKTAVKNLQQRLLNLKRIRASMALPISALS